MQFVSEIEFDRLRQGDENALKVFFIESFPLFVSFAQNYLGKDENCEDVVQDTFMLFWERRESFVNVYYAKAFFYKTIRHKCLNYLRHQKITLQHQERELKEQKDIESNSYFLEKIIQEEAARIISEEVMKLSEMGRKVTLLAMEGLSNEEIAEKLGISINTVRTHKARTYQYLRRRLGELRCLLILLG